MCDTERTMACDRWIGHAIQMSRSGERKERGERLGMAVMRDLGGAIVAIRFVMEIPTDKEL